MNFIYQLILPVILGAFFGLVLAGCASQPIRIDFSCISHAESDRIVTNCADPETWRRWIAERQQGQWQ